MTAVPFRVVAIDSNQTGTHRDRTGRATERSRPSTAPAPKTTTTLAVRSASAHLRDLPRTLIAFDASQSITSAKTNFPATIPCMARPAASAKRQPPLKNSQSTRWDRGRAARGGRRRQRPPLQGDRAHEYCDPSQGITCVRILFQASPHAWPAQWQAPSASHPSKTANPPGATGTARWVKGHRRQRPPLQGDCPHIHSQPGSLAQLRRTVSPEGRLTCHDPPYVPAAQRNDPVVARLKANDARADIGPEARTK